MENDGEKHLELTQDNSNDTCLDEIVNNDRVLYSNGLIILYDKKGKKKLLYDDLKRWLLDQKHYAKKIGIPMDGSVSTTFIEKKTRFPVYGKYELSYCDGLLFVDDTKIGEFSPEVITNLSDYISVEIKQDETENCLVKRHGVILSPNGHQWEREAVFNPGIAELDGVVHMLYRAFGKDETTFGSLSGWRKEGISRLGHATSKDGINYKREDEPVFVPEGKDEAAGVEDPRITKIDDTFYMMYTAFSGKNGEDHKARVALASTTDFHKFDRYGVILPGNNNKDAVLFPEKINGSYAMLHRRDGRNIWLAYSDDLIHWGDHRIIMKPKFPWEERKIGASVPPIKTERGWLEIYHGVNGQYSLGAVLLDLENPSKIIARCEKPILKPEMEYEKKGIEKDVVFACGAYQRNGSYLIPCGVADTRIALVEINKKKLHETLKIA